MADISRKTSFWAQLLQPKRVGSFSPLGAVGVYALLGLWSLVILFPIYWLVVTSLKLPIHVNSGPVYLPFVDFQPSLHAWRSILIEDGAKTLKVFTNSVIVTLGATVLCTLIGSMAAYALARMSFRPKLGSVLVFAGLIILGSVAIGVLGVDWRFVVPSALAVFFLTIRAFGNRFRASLGNQDILFWMLSQRILPPVVTILPVYLLFQNLGLLDTHLALILTFTVVNLPIVVWLMHDFFAALPIELEESAKLDGASRFYIFREIVLPLSRTGLAATSLLVLILAWNEYLMSLFLTSTKAQTMPILIAVMNTGERGVFWWSMSAIILLMIIPVILMAFFLQRFISKGLLIGAVKG